MVSIREGTNVYFNHNGQAVGGIGRRWVVMEGGWVAIKGRGCNGNGIGGKRKELGIAERRLGRNGKGIDGDGRTMGDNKREWVEIERGPPGKGTCFIWWWSLPIWELGQGVISIIFIFIHYFI